MSRFQKLVTFLEFGRIGSFLLVLVKQGIEQGLVSEEQARLDATKEGAAVIGFTAAFAAYGGFFIPKSYGSSIAWTGGPEMALYGFIVFYATCLAVTWWWYFRRGAETPC